MQISMHSLYTHAYTVTPMGIKIASFVYASETIITLRGCITILSEISIALVCKTNSPMKFSNKFSLPKRMLFIARWLYLMGMYVCVYVYFVGEFFLRDWRG